MGGATGIACELLGQGSFLTLVVDTEKGPFCDNSSSASLKICVLFSVYVTLPHECLFKKKTLLSWSVDKQRQQSSTQKRGTRFNLSVWVRGRHIPQTRKFPCPGIVLEQMLVMEILLGSHAHYHV